MRTLGEFDPHLSVRFEQDAGGGVTLRISPRQARSMVSATESVPPPAEDVQRIRVGGGVQAMKIVKQITPAYPALAKQAGLQGLVRMNVVIGKDGKPANIRVEAGHPLLIPAAMEALRQWEYAPTLLNGNPVEVVTQVDVNFALAQ